MACSCKSSSSNVTPIKQVVKKTNAKNTSSKNTSSKIKQVIPQRTVSRRISYRRPI